MTPEQKSPPTKLPTPTGRASVARAPGAVLAAAVIASAVFVPFSGSASATSLSLAPASGFAVLAGTGVTNTGPTVINGDVGTFPTPAITGLSSLTVNGVNHGADRVTQIAKGDLTAAYLTAASEGPSSVIADDLGGKTLAPGAYRAPSSAGLTGPLTLDAAGNPDAVFVFQIGSKLTTASASSVHLVNGAQACHVFWQVGSSATLGTGTDFVGNILALTSVTVTHGTSVVGRILARNGAVTLDSNTLTVPTCRAAAPPVAVPPVAAPPVATTPVGTTPPGKTTPVGTKPPVGTTPPGKTPPVGTAPPVGSSPVGTAPVSTHGDAPLTSDATTPFVVLAGTGVTNTGASTLGGDVGTFPTPAITGQGALSIGGVNHGADIVTQTAKNALVASYDAAAAKGPTSAIDEELGGRTLTPGAYSAASAAQLTGPLTLDAGGDPNAVFVFQIGSKLTTAAGSAVKLVNGAQACHVYWQVGSSATLGTASDFRGNILALTSVALQHAASVEGRVLARNGAVTLDANTITFPVCATPSSALPPVTTTPPSAPKPAAPTPGAPKRSVPVDPSVLVTAASKRFSADRPDSVRGAAPLYSAQSTTSSGRPVLGSTIGSGQASGTDPAARPDVQGPALIGPKVPTAVSGQAVADVPLGRVVAGDSTAPQAASDKLWLALSMLAAGLLLGFLLFGRRRHEQQ